MCVCMCISMRVCMCMYIRIKKLCASFYAVYKNYILFGVIYI